MIRFIYGTGNKEKIKQVEGFFHTMKINVEILSLKDIGFDEEIEENGSTFEENSKIKAEAIKRYCDKKQIKEIIVADDTGLCVDILNGEPGIHSARYAGDHAPQEKALEKLLRNMQDVEDPNRTARFICVLTAIMPNGEEIVVKGTTEGKIATKPGPMGKLTYGPIFIPEGFNKVMNELTDEELGTTHREKAFLELIKKIG